MSQTKYTNFNDPDSFALKEITLITLMEIPFQYQLNIRPIHKLSILWCQENCKSGELEHNKKALFKKGTHWNHCNIQYVKYEHEAIQVIKSSIRVIMIVVP